MKRFLISILFMPFVAVCGAQEDAATAALKKLAKDYYDAVQSEDLEKLTPLLAVSDGASLRQVQLQYHIVFEATQVKISKLEVKSVSVDKSGLAAGITVHVEANVSNHDGSETHKQNGNYVLVARVTEKGWGIVKVMREADVKLARRLDSAERRGMKLYQLPEK